MVFKFYCVEIKKEAIQFPSRVDLCAELHAVMLQKETGSAILFLPASHELRRYTVQQVREMTFRHSFVLYKELWTRKILVTVTKLEISLQLPYSAPAICGGDRDSFSPRKLSFSAPSNGRTLFTLRRQGRKKRCITFSPQLSYLYSHYFSHPQRV